MAKKNSKRETIAVKSTPYFERDGTDLKTNQSKLSLVLGALIVLVVGILIFNYFNKPIPEVGPAQNTQTEGDVSPENLPGKYTVKEGDTLFLIAEKYYQDGEKFTEIARVNNLTNTDMIEVGQVLEIPKLETDSTQTSPAPTASPTASPETTEQPAAPADGKGTQMDSGTGGGNITIWGPKIEDNTYTVVEGDWLSKIAGRAYGDILAYQKLAEVNNIINPDYIVPGMVLTIPR